MLVRLLGKFQTTETHVFVHMYKCTCHINTLRTNYGKAKRWIGREAGAFTICSVSKHGFTPGPALPLIISQQDSLQFMSGY